MIILYVWGTLKKGKHNHFYLEKESIFFISKWNPPIDEIRLSSLTKDQSKGELYLIDEKTIGKIDNFEETCEFTRIKLICGIYYYEFSFLIA